MVSQPVLLSNLSFRPLSEVKCTTGSCFPFRKVQLEVSHLFTEFNAVSTLAYSTIVYL